MAGWRRAVELAMTAEEIETLTALSRSRPRRRAAWSGRKCCSPIASSRRFLPWDKNLAYTIRRSSAASSGHWPMARWRPSTTDRDRARSRRSRRKRKPGWYLWRAIRPRSTAIRTSCGRRQRLLARHARERGPAAGHNCSAHLVQGTVQDPRPRGHQAAQGALLLERRDAEFEQKMAQVLCVYREVQVLKKAAANRRSRRSRQRSSPTTRSRASRSSLRRRRICHPCQNVACDLRARS